MFFIVVLIVLGLLREFVFLGLVFNVFELWGFRVVGVFFFIIRVEGVFLN